MSDPSSSSPYPSTLETQLAVRDLSQLRVELAVGQEVQDQQVPA
jgi:hypothetical protein